MEKKMNSFNIGFDATAFSNRVNMTTVDLYQRRSKTWSCMALLLFQEPMNQFRSNTGTLQNRGIDLGINAKVLSATPLTGRPARCSALIRTKVISLGSFCSPRWRFRPHHRRKSPVQHRGFARQYFYGFVTEGIFSIVCPRSPAMPFKRRNRPNHQYRSWRYQIQRP